MKKIYLLGLITMSALFLSCEKKEPVDTENQALTEDVQKSRVLDLMLKASTDPIVVGSMNDEAIASLNVGLEESVYLEEIMSSNDVVVKSTTGSDVLKEFIMKNLKTTRSGEDVTMVVDNVEIYWPYSDNWDGHSQPVIVVNEYDDSQFIEDDKVYAYRAGENGVEILIVDEEYSKSNPVWVINESDVTLEDIINHKARRMVSASENPNLVGELVVTTITSTVQHDSWIDGGSEYVIYWCHEDFQVLNNIRVNETGQIKFSRKEIGNSAVKQIDFIGNFDWSTEQRYNRVVVKEFDPGNNEDEEITLTAYVNGVVTELRSTILTNETDEDIMNYHIPRTSMFTNETYIDDMHYQKSFSGNGVTLQTTLSFSPRVDEL